MDEIMFDNWSLEDAFTSNESYRDNTSWQTLLMSLLLWDKIVFYDDYSSRIWKSIHDTEYSHLFLNVLTPVSQQEVYGKYLDSYNYETQDLLVKNLFYPKFNAATYNDYELPNSLDIDLSRIEFYLLLSNSLGINLLLHPNRDVFLQCDFQNYFSRMDLWRVVDKELNEYYEYINQCLGRKLLAFQHPVLYDYISINSSNKKDEVLATIAMRNTSDIKEFRTMISATEDLINKGDTPLLLAHLESISNTAKEITHKYNKKLSLGEISIGLSPSITLKIPEMSSPNRKKVHTTFIRKVVQFGVEQRPISRKV